MRVDPAQHWQHVGAAALLPVSAVAVERRELRPLAALLYVSNLGNFGLHVGCAVRHRHYDPGSVTAIATLAPVAIGGLRELYHDERVSRGSLWAGITAGVAFSVGLPPVLRLRMKRSQPTG